MVAVFSIPRYVENETTVEFFGPTQKDNLIFLNEKKVFKSRNELQFRLEGNRRTTVGFIKLIYF